MLVLKLKLRLCAARCGLLHNCHEAVHNSSLSRRIRPHPCSADGSAINSCSGWITVRLDVCTSRKLFRHLNRRKN